MNLMSYSENGIANTSASGIGELNEATFLEPNIYSIKLNMLADVMPSLLDEFKTAYVFYNMAPTYGDYQTNFFNTRNNVLTANADLFMETNNIEKGIETINADLQIINEEISNNKSSNIKLKKSLGIADSRENSSQQMIDDYKELYNLQYLSNFNTFLGVILSIYLARKIFQ